ncbi:MAG: hypothetical protein LAP38_13845 [Acidobacteriia bacterium]|nr:hypothetical protein [Terriglobia bacterium]
MKCRLCETRKPRRYCPGVSGDICSICCGAEREVSVDCPLDCPYLAEARLHEKLPELNPEETPNRDVRVSEEFLREHEPLLIFLGAKLLEASLATSGVVDSDVREALDSLIRTYRTLQSGLYYETKPANPIAAAIHQKIQEAVEVLRKELTEKGATTVRDAEVLGVLVFLQRLELHHNNGRPRGRAFIGYLHAHFPHERRDSPETPSLIQV